MRPLLIFSLVILAVAFLASIFFLFGGSSEMIQQVFADKQTLEPRYALDPTNTSVNQAGKNWGMVKADGLQLDLFNITWKQLPNGYLNVTFIAKSPILLSTLDTKALIGELKQAGITKKTLSQTDYSIITTGSGQNRRLVSANIVINKDLYDFLKVGNASVIWIYQDSKSIVKGLPNGKNITATLYKNISGNWNNTVNSVWVRYNGKFGADDNYSSGNDTYKYIFTSPLGLGYDKNSKTYFFRLNNTAVYKIDTLDICTKKANCKYKSSKTNNLSQLEIVFNSNGTIDPSFIYYPNSTNSDSAWYEDTPDSGSLYGYTDVDATAYGSTELDSLQVNDDSYVYSGDGAATGGENSPFKDAHRLKINTFATPRKVYDIGVYAETDIADQGGSWTGNKVQIYVGNESSSSWTLLDSQSLTSPGQYNLVGGLHGNLADYVSNTGYVTFLVFANGTSGMVDIGFLLGIDYFTTSINVSEINVTLSYPPNNARSTDPVIYFSSNMTSDYFSFKNATLYVWNSTSLIGTNYTNISGNFNQTNMSINLPRNELYHWTVYACDVNNNCESASKDHDGIKTYYNYTVGFDNAYPLIDFQGQTLPDTQATFNKSVQINVSIYELYLKNLEFTWNGTTTTIYDNNLTLMLNFDNRTILGENGTSFKDMSNNDYSSIGVAFESNEGVPGKYGNALNFTGHEYINVSGDTQLTTGASTVSFWARPSGINYNTFMEFNIDGTGMILLSYQDKFFFASRGYVQANGDISLIDGGWNYLTFVYTGGDKTDINSYKIYVNGVEDNKNNLGIPGGSFIHNSIGFDVSSTTEYYKGDIDEVRVWSRELSAAEINEQYFSNLRRLDFNNWEFYVNQSENSTTGLANGVYTYSACATDRSGLSNCTSTRSVSIGDSNPPYFTNLQANKTNPVAGERVNLTATVLDNMMTDTAWLETNSEGTVVQQLNSYSGVNSATLGNITWRGQSFTATSNGYVLQVCLNMSKSTTATARRNVTINIYNVNQTTQFPIGSNLSSPIIIRNDSITGTGAVAIYSKVCGNFSRPVQISNGQKYAIVVSSPTSIGTAYFVGRSSVNAYGGGLYLSSSNSGGTWTSTAASDLHFTMWAVDFLYYNQTFINVNSQNKAISSVIFTESANANIGYRWCANDTSQNVNCSSYVSLPVVESSQVDTIKPNGSINLPLNNSAINGNITIDGQAADNVAVLYASLQYTNSTVSSWTNVSGCEQMVAPYDCLIDTKFFTDQQRYNFKIVPVDTSMNINLTTQPKTYLIDRSIPVDKIYLTYPEGQSSVRDKQNVVIKFNVTDGSGAGINYTAISLSELNGTGNKSMLFESGSADPGQYSLWNMTVNISIPTGLKNVSLYAYDNATPLNNLFNPTVQVIVDNNAPTYRNFTNDAVYPVYDQTEVNFILTAYDNFNLSYWIFENNFSGEFVNVTGNFTNDVGESIANLTLLSTGNYSYRWYVYDDAGNYNITDFQTINVVGSPADTLLVELISPEDDALVTNPVNFTYNYTNGTASACVLYLDGTLNQTTSTPVADVDLSFLETLPTGLHNWKVSCNNTDGAWFDSEVRAFTIDETPVTDTSFTVSLPSQTTEPVFYTANKTQLGVQPFNQTGVVPFFTITSTANVNLNFSVYLNETLPATVTFKANNVSNYALSKVVANAAIEICSIITPSGTCGIWLYSDFSNAPNTNYSRDINISAVQHG